MARIQWRMSLDETDASLDEELVASDDLQWILLIRQDDESCEDDEGDGADGLLQKYAFGQRSQNMLQQRLLQHQNCQRYRKTWSSSGQSGDHGTRKISLI